MTRDIDGSRAGWSRSILASWANNQLHSAMALSPHNLTRLLLGIAFLPPGLARKGCPSNCQQRSGWRGWPVTAAIVNHHMTLSTKPGIQCSSNSSTEDHALPYCYLLCRLSPRPAGRHSTQCTQCCLGSINYLMITRPSDKGNAAWDTCPDPAAHHG